VTSLSILNSRGDGAPVGAGYKVDISRGKRIGRVSSEWFSRPDDERFLSLTELYEAVKGRADRATSRTVETRDIRVEAQRDDPDALSLIVPGRAERVEPTNWRSASSAAWSARRRDIFASCPDPCPGSTCSTACRLIAAN
jgi:hypothetical protein